jgi:hypothetical protein
MALKFVQTFQVRGSGRFPIDMLRYDHCFPAAEEESPKIAAAVYGSPKPWEVRLKRYIELSAQRPTGDRWRSFSAEVVEESIETKKLP